jgi:hypothetical protein
VLSLATTNKKFIINNNQDYIQDHNVVYKFILTIKYTNVNVDVDVDYIFKLLEDLNKIFEELKNESPLKDLNKIVEELKNESPLKDLNEKFIELKTLLNLQKYINTETNKVLFEKYHKEYWSDYYELKDKLIETTLEKYVTNDKKSLNSEKNGLLDIKTNPHLDKYLLYFLDKELTEKQNNIDVTSFITKYHCPLRFQGNYISESIKSFETIAEEIQSSKFIDSKQDDIITPTIKELLNINKDSINYKKLVIFTCIRLDKYVKNIADKIQIEEKKIIVTNPIEDEKKRVEDEKKRIENTRLEVTKTIEESLIFAHCVNPVRTKNTENTKITDRYYDCSQVKGESTKEKVAIQVGGYYVDNNYLTVLQNVFIIYIIKILRWKYHEYNNKSQLNSENNSTKHSKLIIDYIVSMMFALCMYAFGNDMLFYSLLFDMIISSLIYLKTKNSTTLLLPYFSIFMTYDVLQGIQASSF